MISREPNTPAVPTPEGAEDYSYFKLNLLADEGLNCKHNIVMKILEVPAKAGVHEAYVVRYHVMTRHLFTPPAAAVATAEQDTFIICTEDSQEPIPGAGSRDIHAFALFQWGDMMDLKVVFG